MANTTLTATAVTREALRILHQKLNFVGTINRSYDSSFGNSGAKIGDTLKIRLPNQYSIRTGAALTSQNVVEAAWRWPYKRKKAWIRPGPAMTLVLTLMTLALEFCRQPCKFWLPT